VAETLEQVYGRHRQGLFTVALSITRCAARAEDAVHDAFVRMCRNSAGEGKGDLVAYAYAAVRNAAIDQRRRMKAQPKMDSIFNGDHDAAERGAIEAEREAVVAAAIQDLPEEQREAVVLRIYAQLTFAQIAQVVDAPLQTVATRYRRSLERLRERLGRLV
jgi:RNA polymerase sigma-70 factor, ECF subfamily